MDDTQDIFLNERREYSRRVRDEEGATQKTDIKKQKEKNPNSLSVGLIIIIIIIGCGLLGWIIGAGGA